MRESNESGGGRNRECISKKIPEICRKRESGEWKVKMKPKFKIESSVLCIKDIYIYDLYVIISYISWLL